MRRIEHYTLTSNKGDVLRIEAHNNGSQYIDGSHKLADCCPVLWRVADELEDPVAELLSYAILNSDVTVGDTIGSLTFYHDPEDGYQATWAEDAHGFIDKQCHVLETLTFTLTDYTERYMD